MHRLSACVASPRSCSELPRLCHGNCLLPRCSRLFASQVAARSSGSSDEYAASVQRQQQQPQPPVSSSALPAFFPSVAASQASSQSSPYSPPQTGREQLYDDDDDDDDALSADDDAVSSSSSSSAKPPSSSPLSPPQSFLSGPPSFVAPMLHSLLNFIQAAQHRRAQTEQSSSTAAVQSEHEPLPAPEASPSPASTASPALSTAAVSASLSRLNVLDPAFNILFPVYPLPPSPPLYPSPPFPCPPPLSQRTAASYAAYLSSLSPRTRLHVHLLAAADADNRFRSWVYSQLVSRAGQETATFDRWMRLVTGNRVKALQQRQLQEMRLCLSVWLSQPDKAERQRARQLMRQWEATQLLRQSLTQLTRHVQRKAQAEAEGRQQDAQAAQQAIRRREESVRVYTLLWCRAAGRRAKEAKGRAERLIQSARRGVAFVPSPRGVGSEERLLESRRAALVDELMEEQRGWWEQRHRQQATQREREQQQSRRLRETEQSSRLLQPIDASQPPSTFSELLSFFLAPSSAQMRMEVTRHRFWLRERGRREEEELWAGRDETATDDEGGVQEAEARGGVDEQAVDDDASGGEGWHSVQKRQRRRWLSFLQREQQQAADCLRHQLEQDEARRRCIRSRLRTALLPLQTITGADVRAALRLLQPFLALLPPLPSLTPASPPPSFAPQTAELQAATSSSSAALPAPPGIPVSPYSEPYLLSWCHGVRGVTEVRERLYADDEGNVVVELVGVRRDAAVWLYDELRALAAERRLLPDERMMRVQRSGDEEEEGEEVEREDEGRLHPGLQAARRSVSTGLQRAQRAQLGWTLIDLGDAVLQTFSDDQLATLGAAGSGGAEDGLAVGRRREIGEEEAQRRLAALPVSRLNLVSRA